MLLSFQFFLHQPKPNASAGSQERKRSPMPSANLFARVRRGSMNIPFSYGIRKDSKIPPNERGHPFSEINLGHLLQCVDGHALSPNGINNQLPPQWRPPGISISNLEHEVADHPGYYASPSIYFPGHSSTSRGCEEIVLDR